MRDPIMSPSDPRARGFLFGLVMVFATLGASCAGDTTGEESGGEVTGEAKQEIVGAWSELGPAGYAFTGKFETGRLSGSVLDIDMPSSLEWRLATAGGGSFRYQSSPTALTSQDIGTLGHSTIATKPGDFNTVLVGTGEFNANGVPPPNGIWRTTDLGATMTSVLSSASTGRVFKIRFAPSTPNVVYAATEKGLFRSTDSGATWPQQFFASQRVFDVAINPWVNATVYASIESVGLKRTTDSGTTWSALAIPGTVSSDFGRTTIAIAPSLPSTVYVQVAKPNGDLKGIFRTQDAALSWVTVMSTPLSGYSEGDYANAIAVSPTDPSRVLSGFIKLYLTTNGGTSWTFLEGTGHNVDHLHSDNHAIAWLNGSTVAAAHDGGISVSSDSGLTWSSSLNTIPNVLETHVSVVKSGASVRIAASAWDTGFHTMITGGSWTGGQSKFTCCDWNDIIVDPGNTSQMWGTQGMPFGRRHTTDGGSTWTGADAGLPAAQVWTRIRHDSAPPVYIYTSGDNGVFKSTDNGTTWAKFPSSTSNLPDTVFDLAVSPYSGGASVLWAALGNSTSNRLQVYDPALGSWQERVGSWSSICTVWKIVAHPTDAQTAFALLAPGGGCAGSRVWKTTNKGVTWTSIFGNLPSWEQFNGLVVHPTNPSLIFLSSNSGIYRTSDGGTTWSLWKNGLVYNTIPSLGLDFTYDSGTGAFDVYGSFWGRGIWKRDGTTTD